MPIYEFYCVDCDDVVEEILPVGDHKITCKKCGNPREKVMSRFLGIVKGSSNRLLDCIIGESSEDRWKQIHKRKKARDEMRNKKKENKNVG